MVRFASLSSTSSSVRGRLQAQLFHARDRKKELRQAAQLGPTLFYFQDPTIADQDGSEGAFADGEFSNAAIGTNDAFPTLAFDIPELEIGETYIVTGLLSGDTESITQIRLATSGTDNDVTYDPLTGIIAASVEAGAESIQFVGDGTALFTVEIVELILRKVP